MASPYVRLDDTGYSVDLVNGIMTVGRGPDVDICIAEPTVSRLHAEIVRNGVHVYVSDIGSTNGTRVNGRPVGRRVLHDGDVVNFGAARCRIGGVGLPGEDTVQLARVVVPDLTRREMEVLALLCRPAKEQDAFITPASAREMAAALFVTEAAVKQHLLRLYSKFHVPEGTNRRSRLANAVVNAGVVRPDLGEDLPCAG